MSNLNKLFRSASLTLFLAAGLLLSHIQISGQANPRSLSCVSFLQVSLGANGEAILTPEILLAQNHPDYSIFEVTITDPSGYSNVTNCDHLNQVITVMVTNNNTNNSCWSSVLVEDKMKPVIECEDKELECYVDTGFDDPNFFVDELYDNCTDSADIDLWYTQTPLQLNGNCSLAYSATYTRTWTATDESGNSSSCEQTITFQRGNINDVDFPESLMIDCPAASVLPEDTGSPTLDGEEIAFLCMIDVNYTDQTVDLCHGGQSYKIIRTWTLIDWCTNEMRMGEQLIEVIDTIPPVFNCPNDITISTSMYTCTAAYVFPSIDAEDACSDPTEIDILFKVEGVPVFDPITYLEVGEHIVEVEATDPCNNTSTCEYVVTVEDQVAPILVCHPLVIGLSQDEVLTIPVGNLTDSFDITDNCGVVEIEVRRMVDRCNNPSDLEFGSSIDICCADVTEVTTIEVKATDESGNYNFCMVDINVQDKIPPVITCPDPRQINCNEEMEDFSEYGEAEVEGGCVITFEELIDIDLDVCGEGEIFRTIVAENGGGLTDTCVQIITVVNPFDFSLDDIVWPDSIKLTECDPEIDPDSLGSRPEVTVDFCSMVFGIYYVDSTVTDLENCETVFRTWTVVDSCNANESMSRVQVIEIDIPEGPEITTTVDTTAVVECLSQAGDPERPTVMDACGEEVFPTLSSVSADLDSLECEGTVTYSLTYFDCSGSSLDWTFVYTIQRTTPPSEIDGSVNDYEVIEDPEMATPPQNQPLVTDVCGEQLFPGDPDEGGTFDGCEGTITYTYTYTDCAGLEFIWVFTYDVIRSTPPSEVGDPVNTTATVDCPSEVEEPELPLVQDVLGVTLDPGDPEIISEPDPMDCQGSVTYIYTYEDCAGLTFEWQFEYTVEYEDFQIGESNVIDTIPCPFDIVEPTPPIVFDNCGNELEAVLVETPEIPECEGLAEYVFNYEDCAGNIQVWSYSYEVIYQPFQTIDDFEFPIMCPGDIDMPAPPEVNDNCGNELDPIGDPVISEIPDCEGMVTVTWTFEDCAGNTDDFTGTFIIERSDPPQEVGVPVETVATVECLSSATEPSTLPVVEDACGNILEAPDPMVVTELDTLDCQGSRTYTYTYIDCAGLEYDWFFTYNIERSTPPSEVGDPVPAGTTVECLEEAIPPTELPQVEDVCGNVLEAPEPEIEDNLDALNCEGTRTYTYTYEDCAGLEFTWEFTYTIDLQTPPSVEENGEGEVECPEEAVEPDPPVALDECGNELAGTLIGVETDTLSETVFTITYTFEYTDCAGNSSDWSFVYTVEDVTNPTIVCPGLLVVGTDEGECFATDVEFLDPIEVDDNCGVDTVIIFAPDTFFLGTITIVYQVVDLSGNTNACETSVMVVDDEAPEVICPDNIVVDNEEEECEVEVDWTTPVPTDNCGIDTLIASHEPGDTFPVGITTITYIAIDESGNSDTCTFTIEVLGADPLTIVCPDNIEVENSLNECGADLMIDLPMVSGGCGMLTITNDFNNEEAASGFYPVGTTTVTYMVTDENGHPQECEFEVTVNDTEDPVILDCPEDQTVDTDTSECFAIVEWGIPEADDNCPGVVLTSTHEPGDSFEVGTTTVTYTATDTSGNSVECSFEVTVEDNEDPEVICPNDIVIENEEEECEVEVFWDIPEPTDNCVVDTLIASHEPGDTFPIGITEVTYIVIDGAGNEDSCSFTIEVLGGDPLTIECPDNIVAENESTLCEADLSVPLPTVSGGCGMLTITNDFNNEEAAGGVYPVGTTVVTYTVTDESGNTQDCEFTVTVEDNEDPVINDCPEDQTVDVDTTECFAVVEWIVPEADDNCPGVILTSTHEPGDTFEVGTTTVTYTATDASENSVECSFEITVEDNEAPTVTCPEDIVIDNIEGECFGFPEWIVPEALDNCPGVELISTHEPGDTFEVGTTTVIYTATDAAGNTTECLFTVVIEDVEDPEFVNCPADTTVSCSVFEPGMDLSQFGEAEAEDNCSVTEIVEEIIVDMDTCSSTGTILREFTAFDESGNNALCTQLITFEGISVLDSTDFIWPGSIVEEEGCVDFHIDSIPPGTAPVLNPEVETCIEFTIVNSDEIIESDTICDQILRTWTVTDVCNNTEWEFEQTINVESTVAPEFVNVADTLEFFTGPDSCEVFVNLDPVEAEDECGFDVTVTNDSPFSDSDGSDASGVYPVGETTFTYTAVDHCGNSSEHEITIVVLDTISPDIVCVKEIVPWGDSDTLVVPIYGGIVSASDNCTDSVDLIFTLDVDDLFLDTLIITCDDLNLDDGPDGSTLFDYWIYVIDEFGNIDSCKGSLRVDHTDFCDFPGSLPVSGSIYSHSDEESISQVEVYLETEEEIWMTYTDNRGYFEFYDIAVPFNSSLRPYKNDDPLNGVSTFDIFLLQRHILGINVITDPYYLIAADINNDGRINIQDVAELRRLVLGTYDHFLNNTSWRFIDSEFIIPIGVMPTQIDLAEDVFIEYSDDRIFKRDFVGVKIGDLNGNASGKSKEPANSISRRAEQYIQVADREFERGEKVEAVISIPDLETLNGIQFELELNERYVDRVEVQALNEFATIADEIHQINFREGMKFLTLSASSVHTLNLREKGEFLRVEFTAREDGKLSDALKLNTERLNAELFRGVQDRRDVDLYFITEKGEGAISAFELYQNRPNPFTGHTVIPFYISEADEVEFTLFDVSGRTVWSTDLDLQKGHHEIELDAGQLNLMPGVYYYQLNSGSHSGVKKMIVH